jgi:VIT1/CCC1 family predicted Fe2+/Mn2+ transporter
MRYWSREPYGLVLACIGAVLVLFALGAAVVIAAGHSVPPAFWAVGGVAIGILTGLLAAPAGAAHGHAELGPPHAR